MPSIALHPLAAVRNQATDTANPLPRLLHTPTGLALLELQATIHAPITITNDDDDENDKDRTPAASSSLSATTIGDLVFPFWDPNDAKAAADDTSWMKRVYLYVGKHQRLTGEVRKLSRAIAVVARRQEGADDLEVREIVRYKIVFSSRPEPVSLDADG